MPPYWVNYCAIRCHGIVETAEGDGLTWLKPSFQYPQGIRGTDCWVYPCHPVTTMAVSIAAEC